MTRIRLRYALSYKGKIVAEVTTRSALYPCANTLRAEGSVPSRARLVVTDRDIHPRHWYRQTMVLDPLPLETK